RHAVDPLWDLPRALEREIGIRVDVQLPVVGARVETLAGDVDDARSVRRDIRERLQVVALTPREAIDLARGSDEVRVVGRDHERAHALVLSGPGRRVANGRLHVLGDPDALDRAVLRSDVDAAALGGRLDVRAPENVPDLADELLRRRVEDAERG